MVLPPPRGLPLLLSQSPPLSIYYNDHAPCLWPKPVPAQQHDQLHASSLPHDLWFPIYNWWIKEEIETRKRRGKTIRAETIDSMNFLIFWWVCGSNGIKIILIICDSSHRNRPVFGWLYLEITPKEDSNYKETHEKSVPFCLPGLFTYE